MRIFTIILLVFILGVFTVATTSFARVDQGSDIGGGGGTDTGDSTDTGDNEDTEEDSEGEEECTEDEEGCEEEEESFPCDGNPFATPDEAANMYQENLTCFCLRGQITPFLENGLPDECYAEESDEEKTPEEELLEELFPGMSTDPNDPMNWAPGWSEDGSTDPADWGQNLTDPGANGNDPFGGVEEDVDPYPNGEEPTAVWTQGPTLDTGLDESLTEVTETAEKIGELEQIIYSDTATPEEVAEAQRQLEEVKAAQSDALATYELGTMTEETTGMSKEELFKYMQDDAGRTADGVQREIMAAVVTTKDGQEIVVPLGVSPTEGSVGTNPLGSANFDKVLDYYGVENVDSIDIAHTHYGPGELPPSLVDLVTSEDVSTMLDKNSIGSSHFVVQENVIWDIGDISDTELSSEIMNMTRDFYTMRYIDMLPNETIDAALADKYSQTSIDTFNEILDVNDNLSCDSVEDCLNFDPITHEQAVEDKLEILEDIADITRNQNIFYRGGSFTNDLFQGVYDAVKGGFTDLGDYLADIYKRTIE
jgi:hypothetical protein